MGMTVVLEYFNLQRFPDAPQRANRYAREVCVLLSIPRQDGQKGRERAAKEVEGEEKSDPTLPLEYQIGR